MDNTTSTKFLCIFHEEASPQPGKLFDTLRQYSRITLHHFKDDHIGRHISTKLEFYEFPILQYIAQHVPTGGTWVDAGACIGTHTVFFGLFCADKVIAIEPSRRNFDLLCRNIEANGMGGEVVAVNSAITLDGRPMVTVERPDNCGNTNMVDDPAGQETVTPADVIDEKIHFLKIDCEDMSHEVLVAFLPIINQDRPYILIEANAIPPSLTGVGYTEMMNFRSGSRTYLLRP